MTCESKLKRDPGLFMNILGSLGIFIGLLVFGAMNGELRIIYTALAFLGVSCILWVLWLFKLIAAHGCKELQSAVFPLMLLVWIGDAVVEAVRERAVVPTTEYEELYPRFLFRTNHENHRRAVLSGKAALSLSGDLPRIDGATSVEEVYSSFADAVAPNGYPYDRIDCSRTPEAYEHLIAGKADMIFVFRPSRSQIESAAAAGKELRITPIAVDAFVFFTNADNPVNALTVEQLRDIYSGRMENWRDVGGLDARILPYQRYEGSGSQGAMERFMEDDTLMEPEQEHRFRFMRGIVEHAARYRNYESAIGYSFLYYVESMLEGGGVKLLNVDGVFPSRETVQNRSYPLVEEVCVVTAGTKNPQVRPFIDWILSTEGQAMVEALGYIPVNPITGEHPLIKVD